MKIKKISSLVCGFFCILIPCADVFLIPRPSDNWYTNIHAWRRTWENIFDFQFHGQTLQFSWHYIEVWPEFALLSKMATLTQRLSNLLKFHDHKDVFLKISRISLTKNKTLLQLFFRVLVWQTATNTLKNNCSKVFSRVAG